MNLSIIIAPLIGGFIGYITNAIAIKMLFRPHFPKYFLGKKLPFTPGIIPKEKGRIAKSIGEAISNNLMNGEVMQKYLLSDEMINKLHAALTEFLEIQKQNNETLHQFLSHYISDAEIEGIISSIRKELTGQISSKLNNLNMGDKIAEYAARHITDKLRSDGVELNIPGILANIIGPTLWNKVADIIEHPIKNFFKKNINQLLEKKGDEIISNLITNEILTLEETPMKNLLKDKDSQINSFIEGCISFYRTSISNNMSKILSSINIPKIIESRINEMDMDQTEHLIFQVMDKELKAIVWLGALLGTIMGFANCLL